MDVDTSEKESLIIRMKCSVRIDLSLFKENEFTRDSVRHGNPTVVKNENGEFCVAIYNALCGILDSKSSKALLLLSNSKGVKKQAFVGVDPDQPTNHCLVAVNVLAPPACTISIVEQVLSCFQHEWNNYLSFPPEVVQNAEMLPLLKRYSSFVEKKSDDIPGTSVADSNGKNQVEIPGDHGSEDSSPNRAKRRKKHHIEDFEEEETGIQTELSNEVMPTSDAELSNSNTLPIRTSSAEMAPSVNNITSQSFATSIDSQSNKISDLRESIRECGAAIECTQPLDCLTEDDHLKPLDVLPRTEDDIFTQTDHILKSIHRQLNSINPSQNNISDVSPLKNNAVKPVTSDAIPLPTVISTVPSSSSSIDKELNKSASSAISASLESCSSSANIFPMTVKKEPEKCLDSTPNIACGEEDSIQPSCSSQSFATSIDGHRTNISDLPESIRQRVAAIERAELSQPTRRNRNAPDDDGLPNLMDEGGSTGICSFLLARNGSNNSSQVEVDTENGGEEEDDDELNFPAEFLNKRRGKRSDPLADEDAAVTEDAPVAPNNEVKNENGDDVLVVEKDELDDIFDLMSEFPKDVEVEACSAITSQLLPHQKKALNWMMLKENTTELPPFWECITEGSDYFNLGTRIRIFERPKSVNGGILADDMGLGKTLVTISLILTNHRGGKTLRQHKQVLPMDPSDISITDDTRTKKTKAVTSTDFKKPGFQFRQIYLDKLMKGKEKKKKKKKKSEDGMFSNDIDEDLKPIKHLTKHVDSIVNNLGTSSAASSTKKRRMFGDAVTYCNTSLIVCPMTVMSNWTDQFKQHVDPSAKVQIYLYYGKDRIRDMDYLQKHDVVITTYGTLSADYRFSLKERGKESPLHKINWLRIVLDEGHIVRNGKSQQAAAAVKLNAARRWILTGTVIQNRMSDLWSIINFLHIEPFTNRRWWNAHVTKSMDRKAGPGRIPFNRIQKIVKHIAIRRLKTDKVRGQPLVVLPKRIVNIEYVTLSDEERKVYDSMQKDGKFVVSKFFQANTIFKNYANILVIIMRLRQLCCHPSLCTKSLEKLEKAHNIMEHLKKTLDDFKSIDADLDAGVILQESGVEEEEERKKLLEQIMMFLASGDSEECSICLEILSDPVITRCAHIFCSPCINDVVESTNSLVTPCPLCRTDIESDSLVKIPSIEDPETEKENVPTNNTETYADDEDFVSSAKVDMLMKMLIDLRNEDPNIKSLVVSQFTSFLDIVEKPLRKAGFQFVRLDGTMSQSARTDVMEDFKGVDSMSPTIMLLSLTAGGVGLNLISASRVFLLDPAWNPATEEQCFDRCHRLGQKRDVYIHKFIVKDSVEDRMLILQQKKRELMKKAFGNRKQNAQERRRAALQDLGTLLGINLVRPQQN